MIWISLGGFQTKFLGGKRLEEKDGREEVGERWERQEKYREGGKTQIERPQG